jgi:CheY-like chemotaxis protein
LADCRVGGSSFQPASRPWGEEVGDKREHVLVRVRDNGMGIHAEMLARVFDLFTQLDRSLAHSQGGLGVGLTLVRRIVEMHGGSVQAFSAGLGQGSEFVVRLPVLSEGSQPETPSKEANVPSTPLSARRILMVDDNVDGAECLALLLRMSGHIVQTAHDGRTALEAALVILPDVVLLDIGLPDMDGYEVARRMRQEKALEQTRLVALTGYGQEEDLRRSHAAGFFAHLVKPVDVDALRELLDQPELARHVPMQ